MVHYRGGPAAIDRPSTRTRSEFWADLRPRTPTRCARWPTLGCRYLQLDDTSLAYLNDPAQRAELAARGDDAEHQHLRYIGQINAALAGRPEGMAVTTHMCRGNFRSSWAAEGGYDFVAEALFASWTSTGSSWSSTTSAPAASRRCGSCRPARWWCSAWSPPSGASWRRRTTLKRRIDEAAKYVPLEQLCLSPQCGFSSTVEGNDLTYDEQVAKLALVVETAAEVWG